MKFIESEIESIITRDYFNLNKRKKSKSLRPYV
jgi:hypothetical protein